MNISFKNRIKDLALKAIIILPLVGMGGSCSDTWDDHYNGNGSTSNETLWQAISANSDLSNFKHVIEGCGYDKNLNGSQTFSVFAPTNASLTTVEADSLIKEYNKQKNSGVKDDENTVLKQFLKNHISLFSKSVSSLTNDSIVMMNGKYKTLTQNEIAGIPLISKNQVYSNGVLYTMGQQISYFPNVFEYLGIDNDVDSTYAFINSYSTYELNKSKSVAGGIVDGETVYLDSVLDLSNDMFSTLGKINSEDSSYIMVVPTNTEWNRLTTEYAQYFNYDKAVNKRDSIQYANTRLAILGGTVFSRTLNSDAALQDSAFSTNANSYSARKLLDLDPYYIYYKPYAAGGIFDGTQSVTCSNGKVLKAANWNVSRFNTFAQTRKVEAEYVANQDTILSAEDPLTVQTVANDNPFYDKISNNNFVQVIPENTSVNPGVTFKIPNILSNQKYNVYVVFAPALATDTLASAEDRLPCRVQAELAWHDNNGVRATKKSSNLVTTADVVDSLLVFSNVTVPTCSYDLSDSQVTLAITSRVTSTQTFKYTRTMRIDCIIFKPVE